MSCSDVQTIKAGDGSKTQFSFDFPYIFKSEIHVYFWNVTTKEWDEKLTTDSTHPWQITDANPTIVEFTDAAPPAPTTPTVPNEETQDNVRIRRITKVDDIRALFNPGSAIRSNDLNKNFEQLRYAIQESGCQDVPEDLKEYLEEYYWNRYDNTLYDGDTWVSDDTNIASAEAIDDRIDSKIDAALTTDIATDNTGITVTNDGDGTITLGLGSSSIDLDRIKAEDIITLAEQDAGPTTNNDSIFTSSAAAKRFDTLVQTDEPSGSDYETGKTWLQNDDDLTLSVWNGNTWTAVTSGGTFINQPKVIYVDAGAGDDNNDGHRISRPKLTIRAALSDINADSSGDGTIISVAPGIYAETLPLDIEKNDIAIIGQSLRTCIIHPLIPEADEGSYDVDTPHSQELQTMFRLNSGSYLQNLTFMGMKASGTRGASGSLYENATHGLPPNQGWNFAFFPGATIRKSPYIQNCTNFSDSQINNVNFTPHTPGEGAAGDLDSAMTGGGILVDGSVPAADSPLRSIVADSYTHTALNGPGILVTNNGYVQATSSYAFFNHAHITCLNGGQANLAASTSDFGQFALIADGRSPNAIFTSTVDGTPADGDTTFNIDAPTASTDLYGGGEDWFGSSERPATNMLVEVNSITYPILSATANGDGWTVEISRPDPDDRSENLGLNGALTDGAAVSFFLRSMIASSGHTMEYVGSGTDYRALPENGGVPDEDNQKIELNNGKIWTATTDHNGKFTIGGNQTDDAFFEVDQQLGLVTIPEGSIAFNLLSDETPQLGGDLDVNGNQIVTDSDNENIVLNPHGTGAVNVSSSKIINVTDPTADQDAATKKYVDDTVAGIDDVVEDTTPQLGGDLDVNGKKIVSVSDGDIEIEPNGTGDIVLDGNVGIGLANPGTNLVVQQNNIHDPDFHEDEDAAILVKNSASGSGGKSVIKLDGEAALVYGDGSSDLIFSDLSNERMRIDSSGRLLVGTASGSYKTEIVDNTEANLAVRTYNNGAQNFAGIRLFKARGSAASPTVVSSGDTINETIFYGYDGSNFKPAARIGAFVDGTPGTNDMPGRLVFSTTADSASSPTERMRINSSGNVGIGTTSPGLPLDVVSNSSSETVRFRGASGNVGTLRFTSNDAATNYSFIQSRSTFFELGTDESIPLQFATAGSERLRIDSSGVIKHTGSTGADETNKLARYVVPSHDTNEEDVMVFQVECESSFNQITFGGGTSSYNAATQFIFRTASAVDTTTGSERMRIDSSGNVGIGASSPASRVHVKGGSLTVEHGSPNTGTGRVNINVENSSQATFSYDDEGSIVFGTSTNPSTQAGFSEKMRLDSSGRVGIKNSSPNLQYFNDLVIGDGTSDHGITLHAGSSNSSAIAFSDATSGDGRYAGYFQYDHNSNSMRFYVNGGNEHMRLDSSGQALFYSTGNPITSGTSQGAGTTFEVFTGVHSRASTTGSGTVCIHIFSNGDIQNTNDSYGQISDVKLKENIVDAPSQWDDFKAVRFRKYNFKEETGYETHTQLGVIAQEIEQVSPGLVYETIDKDEEGNDLGTTTKAVKSSILVKKALVALQEAMDRIETLEAKVAALEAG